MMLKQTASSPDRNRVFHPGDDKTPVDLGTGDAFLKWVHDHQRNPERCERRRNTCLNEQEQEFTEFPSSEALRALDPSDRKQELRPVWG